MASRSNGSSTLAKTTPKSKVRSAIPEKTYPTDGNATVAQAAEFLQYNKFQIYRLIKKGTIQSIRPGGPDGDIRIPWSFLRGMSKPTKAG